MFLTQEQNKTLEVPFGHGFQTRPRVAAQSEASTYVSPASVIKTGERGSAKPLNLRQVLDLALNRDLVASELGAACLREALNSRLPPIWAGESPIRLELARTRSSDCFAVTVPPQFHNRLHRFPFEDGFLVCPVPDCTGTPKLQGTLQRNVAAQG